ncbi:hypothetical protein D3C71_2157830 [compost metagenome]
MIRLKNNLFVATAFRPLPEQFLIEEGVIGRDDLVGCSVHDKNVSAEFLGFLKGLVVRQRIEEHRRE